MTSLFSTNQNLSLETTANVQISPTNSLIQISSSDFDIRYNPKKKSADSDFILILYEKNETNFLQTISLNRTSDLIETNDYSSYHIQISPTEFYNSIDLLLIKSDNGSLIRVYDLSKKIFC